jgi:uncharacterized membrane protein YfcA
MLTLTILTIVAVLTYSFEIVFGLAGTVMMLPILSLFYDSKTLVIYSVLPQILVAAIGLAASPRTVRKEFLLPMLGVAVLGTLAGLYLFFLFPGDLFRLLLATAITAVGLYLVIAPHRVKLHPLTARALDFAAGVSQGLFGISGPIAMTRLLATFEHKTVVRNYALAFFLPLNITRAAGYLPQQAYTAQIVEMMLVSAPFLVVALWYANRLHFRVREAHFRRVVAWFILLGGLTLFYRGE